MAIYNSLTQETGKKGEAVASVFLAQKGYKILEKNYRIRGGEIDIIAKDHDVLVFIEVKTRRNKKFGDPSEAVTAFKQKQMSKAAMIYVQGKNLSNIPCRFDVIGLEVKGDRAVVSHYINAFPISAGFFC